MLMKFSHFEWVYRGKVLFWLQSVSDGDKECEELMEGEMLRKSEIWILSRIWRRRNSSKVKNPSAPDPNDPRVIEESLSIECHSNDLKK
jgi:hypothetical protein